MSYGTDAIPIWRRAAEFLDKILRGASPAEIPVERPSTFQLVFNEKAALGIAIPPSLQAQGTRWIQ